MGKRKSGQRHRCGKLKQPKAAAHDRGAEYIERREAMFSCFQGGKSGPHLESLIGRVWSVGLLENDRIDPAELRDAGQRYAAAYWGNYGMVPGVANYEGDCRRGSGLSDETAPDPVGERFMRMDALLASAGSEARQRVHELAVDPIALTEHAWIVGLINLELLKKGRAVAGYLIPYWQVEGALARMEDAKRGLLALCEGVQMRRAA